MQKAGVQAVQEPRDSNERTGPIKPTARMPHAEMKVSRATAGTKADRPTAMRECEDCLYVNIQLNRSFLFQASLQGCLIATHRL
jgi:hypothetical protein